MSFPFFSFSHACKILSFVHSIGLNVTLLRGEAPVLSQRSHVLLVNFKLGLIKTRYTALPLTLNFTHSEHPLVLAKLGAELNVVGAAGA